MSRVNTGKLNQIKEKYGYQTRQNAQKDKENVICQSSRENIEDKVRSGNPFQKIQLEKCKEISNKYEPLRE